MHEETVKSLFWIGMAGLMFIAYAYRYRKNPVMLSLSKDSNAIAALIKAGSDVSKPHPIDFMFYYSNQEAAALAVDTLIRRGFSAKAAPAPQGSQWSVKAVKTMVPTEHQMLTMRRDLETFAAKSSGEYDGWGTIIVR